MTEYTPTTDRIRADYAETYEGTDEKRYARFDRWLNEIRAEAWDEGFRIGGNGFIPFAVNPYRPREK